MRFEFRTSTVRRLLIVFWPWIFVVPPGLILLALTVLDLKGPFNGMAGDLLSYTINAFFYLLAIGAGWVMVAAQIWFLLPVLLFLWRRIRKAI